MRPLKGDDIDWTRDAHNSIKKECRWLHHLRGNFLGGRDLMSAQLIHDGVI